MKRLTLLLLTLSVIGVGSLFATGAQEAAGPARPSLEITTLFHFDSGDVTENLDLKDEFAEWFGDYFDIDVTINYYPRPEYMERIGLAMATDEIKGIVQIFGGAHVDQLWADGSTMDWLPLIQDNPNWQMLPEGMKAAYMRDENLVGLPSAWEPGGFFTRHIRQDWLDNLGMELPTTIDELYEVLRAFTEDDPNQSGADDTIGMTSRNAWLMQDIFHSFGIPTNHVGGHLITPDPHDGMLKPQAVDALTWLRDAYQNGYIDPELFTNTGGAARERVWTGWAGSIYDWNHNTWWYETQAHRANPEAEFSVILGLTSEFADRYVNLGGAYGAGAPWVMVRGTPRAQEQANLFIDLFIGDDVAKWAGQFGVYEKYWEFGPNGEIVRLPWRHNDDGTPAYAPGPNIYANNIVPFRNLADQGYIFQGNEEASEQWVERELQKAAWVQEGVDSGLLFAYEEHEKEPRSATYDAVVADIQRIFLETISQAMTGQLTPEQAVASYRTQVRGLGGQRILDEANEFLGRTSSTEYRY